MIKLIEEKRQKPIINIEANVLRKMRSLINECNKEIGWMALSKKLDDNIYYVYELVPVKQEVTTVTTELTESGLQEIYNEFD